jgi:four helix bundle protein
MENKNLENLDVFILALEISDQSYEAFQKIPTKYQTTARQFLDAADSIGANIAEGYGRATFKDRKNFMVIARGSLYETHYWLKVLSSRNLIEKQTATKLENLLTQQARLIYGYIKYLKSKIP